MAFSELKKKLGTKNFRDVTDIARAFYRTVVYSFKHAPYYTGGFLGTKILNSVTPLLSLFIIGKLIDELIRIVGAGITAQSENLVRLLILYLVIRFFILVLNELGAYFEVNLSFDFNREFDMDVARKFAYLDEEYYDNPETNTLLQKVRENSHRSANFMWDAFDVLGQLFDVTSALVVLVAFSPVFIILILLATVPSFINDLLIGKRRWSIWDTKGDTRKDYGYTRGYLSSSNSLPEVRIFRVREYLLGRVNNLYKEFQNVQRAVENKRIKRAVFLDIVRVLGFFAAITILIRDVLIASVTVGSFSFYFSTIRQAEGAMDRLFRFLSRTYEDGLFMVDVYKFMDLEKKIVPGQVCLTDKNQTPRVEIEGLRFKYPGREEYVLDGINLVINPGDHLAIVGENGAGKTTLIKLLMRFYDTVEGKIMIDGKSIKDIDLDSWYRKVGTLFQDFNNYHFDVRTNIGVGDIAKAFDIQKVVGAAKKAGANEFVQKYENKYDQVLNRAFKGGIKPSAGQWQRIALARAFFKDAPILILDEPTSAIDPKAEYELFQKIFEFTKGKTVIIISHRFSTVRNAQKIIVLDKGKIVEQGSHEELMKIEGGKYRTAFELQKRGYE